MRETRTPRARGLTVAALASVGAAVLLVGCSSGSSPASSAPTPTVPSFFRDDAHVTCFSNGVTEAINIGLAKWHGVMHWADGSGAQLGDAQRVDAASGAVTTPRSAVRVVLELEATDEGETQSLRLTAPCT